MNLTEKKNGKKAFDLNLGKVPPQNVDFEEAILGICMLEGHAFASANQFIWAEVFYKDANQKIYDCFCRLFDQNKPIDILTVVQGLRDNGELELVGGAYYVTRLTNSVTSSAHLESWCKTLLELYMKREGIRLCGDLMQDCYNDEKDAFDIFNKADNEIINIQERVLSGQIADIDHYAKKVYEQYETVKATGVLGLKTMIEPFDRVMCGLVAPDLIIIAARPGSGKCLGKGTKVMMYDGSFKKVEDIIVGDVLMGDDSTPRNVLSICSGIENMYRINQRKGISYTVNESHILSLKRSRNENKHIKGDVINIPLLDWVNSSNKFKTNYKGYKVSVDFPEKELEIEPYFLGLWLGDGDKNNLRITKPDIEIETYLHEYAERLGLGLTVLTPKNRCKSYNIRAESSFVGCNSLLNLFKKNNLIGNKHIPIEYLVNSEKNRLELLAGLLDTDGYCSKSGFEIIVKNEELCNQIKYLSDSLGFRTLVTPKKGKIKSLGFIGDYFRITINGDCHKIPTKIVRKKASIRTTLKDWKVTSIDVNPIGVGEYFGFEIDGNRLFLLEDMTVTHNTALALSMTKNLSYDQNIPCAWFSLEMDGVQLVRRMASMITGIDHTSIRNGHIYQNLEPDFYKALDEISRKPIYIEDKGDINIRDLRARAIVLKRKYNIQYIIVDYIQLMSGIDVRNKNRNDVVGEISRGLKQLAKELNIPVIGIAQLSRAVESRSDKIPQLSDLRESGSIEQDADSVLFLMRPEYYGLMNEFTIEGKEYSPNGLCLGVIGKNRHGETKNIAMKWNGATMTMSTHTDGIGTYLAVPQKNISLPYNNQQPRNVSADDGWPTMDEKDLI